MNKYKIRELLVEPLTEYVMEIIERDLEVLENTKKELKLQEQKEIIYRWLENETITILH